jgi:hypothetical protein
VTRGPRVRPTDVAHSSKTEESREWLIEGLHIGRDGYGLAFVGMSVWDLVVLGVPEALKTPTEQPGFRIDKSIRLVALSELEELY